MITRDEAAFIKEVPKNPTGGDKHETRQKHKDRDKDGFVIRLGMYRGYQLSSLTFRPIGEAEPPADGSC